MNLGDLRNAYHDFLGETPDKSSSRAREVDRYINYGHRQAWRLIQRAYSNFFKAEQLFSEVADQAEYDMPRDFQSCAWIERISGGKASTRDPITMHRLTGTSNEISRHRLSQYIRGGFPLAYYISGQSKLVLVPTPTGSATNSLRMQYTFKPADLSDEAHEPFQQTAGAAPATGTDTLEEFHDLIWMEALLFGAAKEEQAAWFQPLKGETLQLKLELRRHLRNIARQNPRTVHRPQEVRYTHTRLP